MMDDCTPAIAPVIPVHSSAFKFIKYLYLANKSTSHDHCQNHVITDHNVRKLTY